MDEVIFCDIIKSQPLQAEIVDDNYEINFVENPQNNMDSEDIKDDPLEQALDEILGNDNYRLKYNYDNFPDTSLYCNEVDKIEAVINKFPAPFEGASKNNNTEDGFLDLKKALRSFRSRKNRNTTMSSRSPSPVFLSQSQLNQERETSTPVLACTGMYF